MGNPALTGSNTSSRLILTIQQGSARNPLGCDWLEVTEYPNKSGSHNKEIYNTIINHLTRKHSYLPKCSGIRQPGFESYPVMCQLNV